MMLQQDNESHLVDASILGFTSYLPILGRRDVVVAEFVRLRAVEKYDALVAVVERFQVDVPHRFAFFFVCARKKKIFFVKICVVFSCDNRWNSTVRIEVNELSLSHEIRNKNQVHMSSFMNPIWFRLELIIYAEAIINMNLSNI